VGKIKATVHSCVFLIQKIIFVTSYYVFKICLIRKDPEITVVGLEEIASMLSNISRALTNSVSVKLDGAKFYNFSYDYDLSKNITSYFKYALSPILLGFLATRYNKFIYLGAKGFLIQHVDGREFEFKFLNKRGVNITCYFLGSEIRSFKLLKEFSKKEDLEVCVNYQGISHQGIDSTEKENLRKLLAESADKHAQSIINPSTDQMSYIQRDTLPCMYFYPDEKIEVRPEKWKSDSKLIIVHAPSSPIIKGTPLVRAAIKKLKVEGYQFQYIELLNVPHHVVLENLAKAHIVLNEFYTFVPGVFGIEAMANNCVLLTSADDQIEKTLPEGANQAWVVTPYWDVYSKLKTTLNTAMEDLQKQADKGTTWTREYCSFSKNGKALESIIGIKNPSD
jgi:hypothetical protein